MQIFDKCWRDWSGLIQFSFELINVVKQDHIYLIDLEAKAYLNYASRSGYKIDV